MIKHNLANSYQMEDNKLDKPSISGGEIDIYRDTPLRLLGNVVHKL